MIRCEGIRITSASKTAEDFRCLDNLQTMYRSEAKEMILKCISYLKFIKEPLKILIDNKVISILAYLKNNYNSNEDLYEALELIKIVSNVFLPY